jgi:hypothetical protein
MDGASPLGELAGVLVTGRVVPAEDEVAVWVGAEDAPGVVPLPDVQATAASEMAMSTTHGPLERTPVRRRLNDIRADVILRVPPQGMGGCRER